VSYAVGRSRSLGLLLAAATFVGSALAMASARAEVPNANSIACPAPPSGWFLPGGSSGRYVASPSKADAVPADMLQPGLDQVTVYCHYFTKSGKALIVSSNYALPSNLNPFNDFDVGCSDNASKAGVATGGYGWNTKDRIYRVVSLTTWGYAAFWDYQRQLVKRDVGSFEAVTQSLLTRSEPAAHSCSLAGFGKEVPIPPCTIDSHGEIACPPRAQPA
jgi:hypothetical protein